MTATTAPSNQRSQLGVAANNLAAPAQQKRTVSPASKKGRTPAKAKARPPPKKDERKSVAQYPTVEGDELADAIPSWTQPKHREGNWDDVSFLFSRHNPFISSITLFPVSISSILSLTLTFKTIL